jgi:hypothetical protein
MVEVKKAELPSTYWGASEKTCPMCAEMIPVLALECPLCKTRFDDVKPMRGEDLLPKAEDPVLDLCRKNARLLLFWSVLGCTSPIALICGAVWYARKRTDIERAGATTHTLVLVSLGVSIAYIVLLAVGLLVFSTRPQR